ncbi:isopenicillin-N N-acyltransferase like protein [Brevibacterium sandarakinum]|uniref:Isopenicillin-N N-acyltransferase like protein n=1 Tax=Brevibacterium sandarakinum TaxID=629680 RepID=A0A1H1TSJ1_BRESA|nr:C45 family peptidase [Brevibacterium sandarakinum]SDS63188.1 isopenicillin-N N-acyltransferase like protein [Brevibacterium sandarakinum]
MSTDYVPAAEVRPEVFTSHAADHLQRGAQRGRELRTGIDSAIAGYRRYFEFLSIAEEDVRGAAAASHARLQEWSPEAAEEVAAVAGAAGVSIDELMEVIARTEIMTLAPASATECSTVSFTRPGASIAAQNWDWAADFSTLWHINDTGSVPGQLRHVGIAEYGMLGKIGLNEAGVGVLLNILKHEGDEPGGVPIHMILERVLSKAETLDEALEIIHSATTTSSSIITVVTADDVVQVEIANAKKGERRAEDSSASSGVGEGFLLHTNHFLHPDLVPGSLELNATSTSRARQAHLERRLEEYAGPDGSSSRAGSSGGPESTAELVDILTTGQGEAPVSCTPDPGAAYGNRSATLVTVQIDPARRQIDLAPGSPADGMRGNRRYQL